MNQFVSWDNQIIRVGQQFQHNETGFIVEVESLSNDPHWLCAVKLKAVQDGGVPYNFFYEQPIEYFLRNFQPLNK